MTIQLNRRPNSADDGAARPRNTVRTLATFVAMVALWSMTGTSSLASYESGPAGPVSATPICYTDPTSGAEIRVGHPLISPSASGSTPNVVTIGGSGNSTVQWVAYRPVLYRWDPNSVQWVVYDNSAPWMAAQVAGNPMPGIGSNVISDGWYNYGTGTWIWDPLVFYPRTGSGMEAYFKVRIAYYWWPVAEQNVPAGYRFTWVDPDGRQAGHRLHGNLQNPYDVGLYPYCKMISDGWYPPNVSFGR